MNFWTFQSSFFSNPTNKDWSGISPAPLGGLVLPCRRDNSSQVPPGVCVECCIIRVISDQKVDVYTSLLLVKRVFSESSHDTSCYCPRILPDTHSWGNDCHDWNVNTTLCVSRRVFHFNSHCTRGGNKRCTVAMDAPMVHVDSRRRWDDVRMTWRRQTRLMNRGPPQIARQNPAAVEHARASNLPRAVTLPSRVSAGLFEKPQFAPLPIRSSGEIMSVNASHHHQWTPRRSLDGHRILGIQTDPKVRRLQGAHISLTPSDRHLVMMDDGNLVFTLRWRCDNWN